MDSPNYFTDKELIEAISHITNSRRRFCSGFKVKSYSLSKSTPKPFIHYDEITRKPLSVLCDHTACCEASEVIYMLVSLFASGVISEEVWKSFFPYRWRQKTGHPFIPSAATRPLEQLCCGYRIVQQSTENSANDSRLQFSRDIDSESLNPFTEICKHDGTCQPYAAFYYALYSIYSRGMIQDMKPHYNSMCPKYLIKTFGWNTLLNKSSNDQESFINVLYHPSTSLKTSLCRLLFDPSSLVKSIPSQRFEPELILPNFNLKATDVKRSVLIDEFSEDSSSDEDDTFRYSDFNVYRTQHMSKRRNSLTARMSFGDNPICKLEKATPLSKLHESNLNIDPLKSSYKLELLGFNVKQDAPGLVKFLCMAATEIEDPVLTNNMKHELRHALDMISDPSLVFAFRRREARAQRKKYRVDLLKRKNCK